MVTTGKYSIADQIKEDLMHQEKDDTKQVDEARDIELNDAELEGVAGGVVINHEEQYSIGSDKSDKPQAEDRNETK